MRLGYGTLTLRSLGRELKKLREANGLSVIQAATKVDYARDAIYRIERAEHLPRRHTLRLLCDAYDASDEKRAQLMALREACREDSRFESQETPPEWRLFFEAESDAKQINVWEPEIIPGLLQIPEYIEALHEVYGSPSHKVHADKEHRRARQAFVFQKRRRKRRMRFLLGAAVLSYLAPRPDLEAKQLARLEEAHREHGADIRVTRGLHPCMYGAFTLLTPGMSDFNGPPLAYIEDVNGARYIEDPPVVSVYESAFDRAFRLAEPIWE